MNEMPHVVIVMARCTKTGKSFGIRFEEKERGNWYLTWAFKIAESSAKREGYDKTKIGGAFLNDTTYPGCPHCESKGIWGCCCEKVACWDTVTFTVTCPWCNTTGELSGSLESMNAGTDR